MKHSIAAFAGMQTEDVTLLSEAIARAILRLERKEESEREQTISCTTSSTPFAKVVMRLTLLQLSINQLHS